VSAAFAWRKPHQVEGAEFVFASHDVDAALRLHWVAMVIAKQLSTAASRPARLDLLVTALDRRR
jgi:hypothetical protein